LQWGSVCAHCGGKRFSGAATIWLAKLLMLRLLTSRGCLSLALGALISLLYLEDVRHDARIPTAFYERHGEDTAPYLLLPKESRWHNHMKATAQALTQRLSRERLGSVYADLFKARLTFLVLLTTVVGFYLAIVGR